MRNVAEIYQRLRKGACATVLLGCVAALVWFSLHLAAKRIYQVDECQLVYIARLLATSQGTTAFAGVSPLLAVLAWFSKGISSSIDIFASARFLMVEIFWLNWILIALATGERLFSRRGLIALAGAATLAPLWDYGFEIRNDNLLLAGILLIWCVVRVRPAGMQSYFIAGAIAAVLQFSLFKSFVYTLPLSFAILLFPPPRHRAPRWKLTLVWIFGALAVCLICRLAYGLTGLWDIFWADVHRVANDATGNNRFGPWQTLTRLLHQVPLLLALLFAALVALGADLRRRGKAALNWEGNLPEALLLFGVFSALLINPTPFPYNLLNLVPFIYIFAFRYAVTLAGEIGAQPTLISAAAAILIFAHLVPFGTATWRHLKFSNTRQDYLARLAESLTDPVKDPVYDGVGLVPTRRSIHYHWFPHSLCVRNFINGTWPHVRDMLAARPAVVIIPNYRTDWLPEEDHAYIREHYVTLADDFWVLGKVLPKGGGSFEIVHPGRYRISSLESSHLMGTYLEGWKGFFATEEKDKIQATVDGIGLSGRPVELAVGTHRIDCDPGCQPVVAWVGPHEEQLPRISRGNHRSLFVNWY